MQDDVRADDDHTQTSGLMPALPTELLARIITFLEPSVDHHASTWPHPSGADLEYTPTLPSSTNRDLLSAASSCKLLNRLAEQALYRSPLIRTLKSLNLFANTIAADAKKTSPSTINRAAWIRSVYLPPGDGLLQPGDTLADQTRYIDSLRTILDHATRLDFVALEHRQAGAALSQFLHPSTACRPRRLTLSNLSFSAPPILATQSLAPLSRLTHLHLIKIVPPPAMISFLVGAPITADEHGNVAESLKLGLSPRATLECLRLSLLPPDALVEFGAYIAWRKAWKAYEQLPSHQQAREAAPMAPRGPARRFAAQEALYDLAVHSHLLPRLRLFLLELSPLGELDRLEDSLGPRTLPTRSAFVAGRSKGHSRARAQESDTLDFNNAIQTSRAAAECATKGCLLNPPKSNLLDLLTLVHRNHTSGITIENDDDVVGAMIAEDLRTSERDMYWRQVEDGKVALQELWRASCDSTIDSTTNTSQGNGHVQIRVVAARPNGHDRYEGFLDFYCQAQHDATDATHEGSSFAGIRDEEGESQAGADRVGCWADPDVFSLVKSAPHLSFLQVTCDDKTGWYWTGELPRETNHPRTLVLPSHISRSRVL